MITDIVLQHPSFAGLHFTGSTFVFQDLWQKIGGNIKNYKTYPVSLRQVEKTLSWHIILQILMLSPPRLLVVLLSIKGKSVRQHLEFICQNPLPKKSLI